jgi:hypothetical protein
MSRTTPSILMLTPYPTTAARHGGQIRAVALQAAIRESGWALRSAGLYCAPHFGDQAPGPDDIRLGVAQARRAELEMGSIDLVNAEQAAEDPAVLEALARLLADAAPDIVILEQPWAWLPLSRVWPSSGAPKLVYSAQNLEWRLKRDLAERRLHRPDAPHRIAQTRALEEELTGRADLIIAISDLEGEAIRAAWGRDSVHIPPSSSLADGPLPDRLGRFAAFAAEKRVTYAAIMGSSYWPNVEGFFEIFPEGLGFLPLGRQIWVAGSMGAGLHHDSRWHPFRAVNDARLLAVHFIPEAEKSDFFAGAVAAVLPLTVGAGAKLKTADALACGRPVVATSVALEGYGPVLEGSLGNGVYLADEPLRFRQLTRAALAGELAAPPPTLREALGAGRMAARLDQALRGLLPALDGPSGA